MTEDMERVHGAISGQVLQLANIASHAAELAVHLSASRARRAELGDRDATARVAERLRTDRELAAAVWARSRSRRWLADAAPEELVAVWASARAWAPHDTRAARAVEALARRVADLGVDAGSAAAALDVGDAAALARMLDDGPEPDLHGRLEKAPGRSWGDREATVLEVLGAAWSDSTVELVAAGDAWPALVHKLSYLKDDGHDIAALAASLPEAKLLAPDIRQPAAFAAWMLDQQVAAEPVRIAGVDYTVPAGEGARAQPETSPAPAAPAVAVDRARDDQVPER